MIQLYQISWLRALLIYVSLVAIFMVHGQLSFYRDPGSIFYDESRAFERHYSAHRQHEIEMFKEEVAAHQSSFHRAGSNPSLCASFVSVRREGEQYLPTAIASGIYGLSQCERSDIFVDVLLAHTNISEHPSAHLPWVDEAVDSLHGYTVASDQLTTISTFEEEKDFPSKAVLDYVHALDHCYDTQTPWIVIFEDDVLLADGWLMKTLQGLQSIGDKFSASANDWLFMRLFNQERSMGWASGTVGENHELLISALIICLLLPALGVSRSRFVFARRHLDNGSIGIVCFLFVPTFVVLFFQAGKMSMLPPRDGVHPEAFGCCSQALVFPRIQVPRVKEYLLSRRSGQIDLMLDDLAVSDSLDRYALYPVQLQHIGQRSVRGTAAREAQAIWSMAFENQVPAKLRKAHMQLADMMYGENCSTMGRE